MPRKPAPRPDDPVYPSDAFDAGLRFVSGAVVGLLLASGAFFFVGLDRWVPVAAGGVVLGAVFGFLSMRFGETFWGWLFSGWWRW